MPTRAKRKLPAQPSDELKRLTFEREAWGQGYKVVAGVDEAGRGPLAGPVVAAACVIPEGVTISGVDDSKKLTPARRSQLFQEIQSHDRISYGIGIVSSEVIDQINILQATIRAMFFAISKLAIPPDYLLVDGMEISYSNISCKKIIRGDSRSFLIAAASILAKVTRDQLMQEYHEKWPQYGFNSHKGYGTKRHVEALKEHGPCEIHRFTFEPIKSL